jgi:hypothetical protein
MTTLLTVDAEFLIPSSKLVQDIFEEKQRLCEELKKLPTPRTREQNDAFNHEHAELEIKFRDAMWRLAIEIDLQLRRTSSHEIPGTSGARLNQLANEGE